MPREVGFLFKQASSIRKILGEMSDWIDTAVRWQDADDMELVRIRWCHVKRSCGSMKHP